MDCKFSIIISEKRLFISLTEGTGCWNYNTDISKWLFNGENPKHTHKKHWYEVSSLPKEVKQYKAKLTICVGFKLKASYVASEAMPEIVDSDFFYDDEYDKCYNEHLKGLYESIIEETPEEWLTVNFEIDKLAHVGTNWEFVNPPKGVQHLLIDEITTPQILLQDKHCFLSEKESYEIIRAYIKSNIDPKVARISDYDFCLTVYKVIQTHSPVPYSECVNPRAKKLRFKTKYRNTRDVVSYECAPKPYQEHTVVTPFKGSSYQDLNQNIQTFLDDLIAEINTPLKECSYCNGFGVTTHV